MFFIIFKQLLSSFKLAQTLFNLLFLAKMDLIEVLLALLVVLITVIIIIQLRPQSPINNRANNAAVGLAKTAFDSVDSVSNVVLSDNCDLNMGAVTQTAPASARGKTNIHIATNSKGKSGPVNQTITPSGSIVVKEETKPYPKLVSTKDGKKGICLILNYFTYPKEKDINGKLVDMNRYGTDKDANDLKALFEEMQFKVILQRDLTLEQTINMLKEVAAMDHSEYTCFILCILAHGVPDNIIIGEKLLSYKAINNTFDTYGNGGSASQSLAEKPKLFFIQACQGEMLDSGCILPMGRSRIIPPNVNSTASDSTSSTASTTSNQSPNPVTYQTLVTGSVFKVISSKSHRFIFTSSYASYASIRLTTEGTWFIQDLVAVFKEAARNTDLAGLCALVTGRVSDRTIVEQTEEFKKVMVHFIKQTPESRSSLNGPVWFF